MTLSDLSIRRPVFAWMIMFGLIVFGAISFYRLGVSQMPDVDFPVLTVNVNWEGAAPEVMESTIVDPLEQSVMSVQGIRDVTSTIIQGQATITLEMDMDRDIDAALQEVNAKISAVRLPLDVDKPTILKSNPDDQPIMWLGVSSTKRSLHDLIVYIDLHLRDQFQVIPDVAEIILSGFSERNLRIWVNNDKLKQYELTILDVQNAIAQQQIEVAAGIIENNKQEMNIRTMGEGLSTEDVGNILISQRGGQPIYDTKIHVKDVARVEDALADVRRLSRINGIPGVGLGIKKQRGSNAVAVADRVKARVAEINKLLPEDMQVVINFDSTKFIRDSMHETEMTLVLAALITGLVCYMFLGSLSSTFNVFLSIPTSIVGTFTILYFMHFTLNFFTLLGLSLAVGIVVDDAIMVLENIVRHMQMGKNRVHASLDGAREITFAAIAASVAVMAIFLPVAFMKGILGKFFFQFGITITSAVALSLLEAITLTPMRTSKFMSEEKPSRFAAWSEHQFSKLANGYRQILGLALHHRALMLVVASLLFGASLFLAKFIRQEFIPQQDMSMFLYSFQTPVGSSLTFTSDKLLEAEKVFKRHKEIARYFVAIGGFQGGQVNIANAFVTLVPPGERSMTQAQSMNQIRNEIMKEVPDLLVFPIDLSTRGFSAKRGYPVEFTIRGESYDVLKVKANEITDQMKKTGLMVDINTDYREGMPEVRVVPDRQRAALSSVSMQTLGDTVNAAIGGVRQNKFSKDGRRYDVRIRLEPGERDKPEDISSLQVRTTYGELIPLSSVASLKTVSTVQSITREMRERAITITSNIAPGASQADAISAVQSIGRKTLPEGYRLFLSGNAQMMQEAGSSFLLALGLGIVVAYMVLAAQFNSFLHPFTVLLALPFSISGALLALLLARPLGNILPAWGGASINLYSGIGIILLMGIVKKNSILLIEFTNRKRFEEGMPLREALLTAGPIRLRPILMTSCATLAAALPAALALGPGAESRIPMAITVIGGVIVSTAFTLIVVPCAYSLLSPLERHRAIPPVLAPEQRHPAPETYPTLEANERQREDQRKRG
ncbi:MAG: efflux RND transporter permease subunit [Verrucomicrobiae bacterium]|nr:efflux RND transporter permease subunit [Verrucomicrobiae bacterium]